MKLKLLIGFLAVILFNTAAVGQCDPNFDFGGAAFDFYPNPDDSESFATGAINEFYADVFHFVFPTDAGEIDPLLGLLGLSVDSLTFDGITTTQDGSEINLNDVGIALTCNNLGNLVEECAFAPNMQYCIALEGTAIESGNFELVFNLTIHAALLGIPSTFPVTLTAIDLQILGFGCADETACNYEEDVIEDNNFCIYGGCMTLGACNYDSSAPCDDGSCMFPEDYYDCDGDCLSDSDGDGICDELEIYGCLDSLACNYNPDATEDAADCFYETAILDCDGECFNDADGDGVCDELEVPGCTDELACNYDSLATDDDGSCVLLETFDITGEVAPVQFSETVYSYPFNASSDYEWEVGSGTIISEIDGSITIEWTEPGFNEVCIIETDSDGCTSAQVCLAVNVSLFIGITEGEASMSNIHIYPVPAVDVLNVSGLDYQNYNFWIYNAQGQMTQSGFLNSADTYQLQVETLSKGIYVLRLESGKNAKSIRFLK